MVSTRRHATDYPSPAPPTRRERRSTSPSPSTISNKSATSNTPSSNGSRKKLSSRKTQASSSVASVPMSEKAGSWVHRPSPIVVLWLALSLPLVIWDIGYCLLRPYSMPGGFLHPLWKPYALYGEVDYMYGWPEYLAHNGFTAAQSFMNLVETVGYLYYLFTVFRHSGSTTPSADSSEDGADEKEETQEDALGLFGIKPLGGRQGAVALLTVFASCVMTLSKTVLYWLNEAFSGFRNIGHNSITHLVLLWVIPNGAWIVFPGYGAYYFGREIVNALQTSTRVPKKEETARLKSL